MGKPDAIVGEGAAELIRRPELAHRAGYYMEGKTSLQQGKDHYGSIRQGNRGAAKYLNVLMSLQSRGMSRSEGCQAAHQGEQAD